MKKVSFLIQLLIVIHLCYSQSWTQKTSLPADARYGAVVFTIEDSAYLICGGNGSTLFNEVWMYENETDSWHQKNNFNSIGRRVGFGFSIGNYGFFGGGWSGSVAFDDFYKYNPVIDDWMQLSDYPGGCRNAMATSASNFGYVGGGSYTTSASSYCDDFWGYDVKNNVWSQKESFPGASRIQSACFIYQGKAIVGGGYELSTLYGYNDYYEYDPKTDTWEQICTFANGNRSISVGFTIGIENRNAGYLATGYDSLRNEINDLWRYKPSKTDIDDNINIASSVSALLYPVPNTGLLNIKY